MASAADVGCVIRRADGTFEAVLTAEQMARFADTPEARRALGGECVFVLYAPNADAFKVGATRNVVKRWNTLDDASPEPLRLVMVWRADAAGGVPVDDLEAYVHTAMGPHALPNRRHWYRARTAASVLENLPPYTPSTDVPATSGIRQATMQGFIDADPAFGDVMTRALLKRLIDRLGMWDASRSPEDYARVRATMTALRSEGVGGSAVLSAVARYAPHRTRALCACEGTLVSVILGGQTPPRSASTDASIR